MKLKTWFTINKNGTPGSLYAVICRMVPAAVRVDDVRIEASSGETLQLAKIAAIVALCKAAGLKRSKLGKIGTYGYVIIREYEECDLAPCQLLRFVGVADSTIQHDQKRDKQGRLILLAKNVAMLEAFGQVRDAVVVSREAREMLEKEGFRGLRFREVGIYGRQSVAHPVQTCWELDASVTLPKLANTDRLMYYGTGPSGKVAPFDGDYSRMVFLDDAPYVTGEMYYRESDLRQLGQFDIARAFERISCPEQPLVISQRFYQHCLKHKIPLEVEPVRIDPD